MRTTLEFSGVPELIVEKAVSVGLARSRADAVRMGVLALNKEYALIKDFERGFVERKLATEEREMHGREYLSKKKALAKYR